MGRQFVESKYHIDLTVAAASQLNRAITHGSEKGIFVLPKGASGKVKLAPKGSTMHKTEGAKEVRFWSTHRRLVILIGRRMRSPRRRSPLRG